jgi:hypothetical protein
VAFFIFGLAILSVYCYSAAENKYSRPITSEMYKGISPGGKMAYDEKKYSKMMSCWYIFKEIEKEVVEIVK